MSPATVRASKKKAGKYDITDITFMHIPSLRRYQLTSGRGTVLATPVVIPDKVPDKKPKRPAIRFVRHPSRTPSINLTQKQRPPQVRHHNQSRQRLRPRNLCHSQRPYKPLFRLLSHLHQWLLARIRNQHHQPPGRQHRDLQSL